MLFRTASQSYYQVVEGPAIGPGTQCWVGVSRFAHKYLLFLTTAQVRPRSGTHFQVWIIVSFALLRAFALGAAIGAVLALSKSLINAAFPGTTPNSPIGSIVIGLLLRILDQARVVWALCLVGLSRLGSVVVTLEPTDVMNAITSFLLACVVYLIVKEQRAQARLPGLRA